LKFESGAEAHALQALRETLAPWNRAKRLECVRFSAAFLREICCHSDVTMIFHPCLLRFPLSDSMLSAKKAK
jgi:hypothetical protein